MMYSAEDKNNDNLNRAMMGRCRRFVNGHELKETPLIGRQYTWSNEREAPMLVKLDRVLCTADWKTCSLTAFSIVRQHRYLIIALSYLISWLEAMEREDFTMKVSGLSFPVFMKSSLTLGGRMSLHLGPMGQISKILKRLTKALQS